MYKPIKKILSTTIKQMQTNANNLGYHRKICNTSVSAVTLISTNANAEKESCMMMRDENKERDEGMRERERALRYLVFVIFSPQLPT